MTAFDTAPEPDDRPARVGTARVPYRSRPSRMARAFRWWLGVSALVLLACVVFIGAGLVNLDLAPVHIVIDGDDVTQGVTVTGMGDDVQALLGVGALMLGLLLLLLLVAIALVIGVGVPLIAVAAVLIAVTSPFWMIGLVVWLVARRRHSPSLPASARMAA
jgi:hypothetical protein